MCLFIWTTLRNVTLLIMITIIYVLLVLVLNLTFTPYWTYELSVYKLKWYIWICFTHWTNPASILVVILPLRGLVLLAGLLTMISCFNVTSIILVVGLHLVGIFGNYKFWIIILKVVVLLVSTCFEIWTEHLLLLVRI